MLMLALNFGMAGVPGVDPYPDFDTRVTIPDFALISASRAAGINGRISAIIVARGNE
jgi:hypothetical protein